MEPAQSFTISVNLSQLVAPVATVGTMARWTGLNLDLSLFALTGALYIIVCH